MAIRKGGTLYYFANDHLGGTAVVMDASGAMVSRTRYYPYGNAWTQEFGGGATAIPTDRLFTGQRRYGARSGIYHYGARFYSADIGRFLSPDSIVPGAGDPQSLNRYSYVANNPLRYTDPTGHCIADEPHNCAPAPTGGWDAGVSTTTSTSALEVVGEDSPYEVGGPCGFDSTGPPCGKGTYVNEFAIPTYRAAMILLRAGIPIDGLPWSKSQRAALLDFGVNVSQFGHDSNWEMDNWSAAFLGAAGLAGTGAGSWYSRGELGLVSKAWNADETGRFTVNYTTTADAGTPRHAGEWMVEGEIVDATTGKRFAVKAFVNPNTGEVLSTKVRPYAKMYPAEFWEKYQR